MPQCKNLSGLLAALALCAGCSLFGADAGNADYVHFAAAQNKVVVVAHQRTTRSPQPFVSVYDLSSGARLAYTSNMCGDCMPTPDHKLWCGGGRREDCLGLRNLDTLARIGGASEIRGSMPILKNGLKKDGDQGVDPITGELLVEGIDERLYAVDTSFHTKVAAEWPRGAVKFSRSRALLVDDVRVDQTHRLSLVSSKSGERRVLGVSQELSPTAPASDYYEMDHRTAMPHPGDSYMEGGFLSNHDTGRVLLANPAGALFAHLELDEKGRKQLAWSRVDNRAEVAWTQLLPGFDTEVVGGEVIDDLAVIATRQTLVGLDAATGAVRYDVGL